MTRLFLLKKTCLALALIFVLMAIAGKVFGQNLAPELRRGERLTAVFEHQKQVFLLSSDRLFQWKKELWLPLAELPAAFESAVSDGKRIWLGGKPGLFFFDPEKKQAQNWRPGTGETADLTFDKKTGELLAASSGMGVFALRDTAFARSILPKTEAFAACHCGNYDWAGTATGLFRISKNGEIQKYAEEGVAGYEVPDNIIDGLFCSPSGALTVAMPEAIAFFGMPDGEPEGHPEHFDYLGEPGNHVFRQIDAPGDGLLFFTEKGVLQLEAGFLGGHDEAHGHGGHGDSDPHAARPLAKYLAPQEISADPDLRKMAWKNGHFDRKNRLWLVADGAIVRLARLP